MRSVKIAIVMALGLTVAACSGGSSTGGTDGGGTSPTGADAAAVADPTAVLRYGPFYAVGLDPVRLSHPCDLSALRTIFDTLVRVGPDGSIQPALATSWEVVDGNHLRLDLREGVVFQDGTPFDAAAVKAHLDRALTGEESTIKGEIAQVQEVVVVDPLTVDLVLDPVVTTSTLVALAGRAGMVASPTAVAAAGSTEAFSQAPVGTGMFAIEGAWTPRERLSVRAWDGYWNPDHRLLGGVDFVGVTADALQGAIRSGQLDAMELPDPLQIPNLEADRSLRVYVNEDGPTFAILAFNETIEPLDDVRVRQALFHAIDRQALSDAMTGGIAAVATQRTGPGSLGYSEEVADMYPYDPDRARALLAEAGLADGFTLPMVVGSSATDYVRLHELIQAQLRDVGIQAEIALIESAQVTSSLYQQGTAVSSATAANVGSDPDEFYRLRYLATGPQNAGKNELPEMAALIQEGASTTDLGERDRIYQELNVLAAEEALDGVPLYIRPAITVAHDYVGGMERGNIACYQEFADVFVTQGREPVGQ